MIPVTVNVRSFGDEQCGAQQKEFRFNVFVHQKWTPYLMMVTLFNSISGAERIQGRGDVPAVAAMWR